ncbi:MAG: MoaD/ThiS family protein [Anaerolineales bacterium]|nr:MoaD/ThiS family protein [Anaerolineales bacterium]
MIETTIQVQVKLYGLLRPHHPGPNRSLPVTVAVPAGATARQVAEALNLPPKLTRLVFINDLQVGLDDPVQANDRVNFFTSVVGG